MNRRAASWALYDLANTLVYAVVVTRFYTPHMESWSGSRTLVAAPFFAAMTLSALMSPWIGSRAARGRAVADLRTSVGLCVLALVCMWRAATPQALAVAYAGALLAYQLSLVAYNACLFDLAMPGRQGRLSGLGVGLGYLGAPLGLGMAALLQAQWGAGPFEIYLATAVAFLALAVPCLLLPRPRQDRAAQVPRLSEFLGHVRRTPALRRFFLGNLMCADALNSVYVFVADFLLTAAGWKEAWLIPFLVATNLLALPAALWLGRRSDSHGPGSAYRLGVRSLAAGLVLVGLPMAAWPDASRILAPGLALAGAVGMAGIWTAGRPWVIGLCPGRSGEGFGLYGVTNKVSCVGVLLYAWVADGLDSPAWALLVPALGLAAGWACLRGVPDALSSAPEAAMP